MAIQLKRTANVSADGVKILVYGQGGSGKTTLIKTLPNPVILSAEGGLLSLADTDIPYIEVTDMLSLREAYQWATESEEAAQYESIALDSLSEIAEVVLSAEKKQSKDPRQAYGALQDTMGEMIRAFRDIRGKHVYFSAKLEKQQDEQGRVLYSPSMPGNKLAQSLPYFFDLVFALRAEKDSEGVLQRALMTETDGLWQAKARTVEGKRLQAYEAPDIGEVIRKLS
ncbi:MAG TPA: ATP-binding protein [Candidatus Paceibacterota bacterium]|nr:ATP-binding protein [Candidatus Paceibacterota bacterium]